ncbi:helix-turn-helix domain-containing protein [Zhaonella formicivorans]|uniref:helix-turn-helix domain-containing protein n=1 Tax=Zhaonella formicivorans TaxID=2528593 RepID=UPI0010ED3F77|nr:helix-turn-helix transcriptional regulator [Zhaonella formicivorans]
MLIKGEKIRELREERGYALADLAEKAGISVSYLSEIERGAKKPSLKIIDKLAQTLNVNKSLLVEVDQDSAGISLGDKLRILRESKGLSLTELASEVGLSVSYLSEIERNNTYPATNTLRVLAEKLGVSVSTLVGKAGPLGSKLRIAREEQGLTQVELAKAAGVSPGLIGQIEHGKVQPSLHTIEKIAQVLGYSPCYFILEDAGIEDMLRAMSPEVREILTNENVQAVLRLVCDCTEKEMTFILNFIKLYKKSGVTSQYSEF